MVPGLVFRKTFDAGVYEGTVVEVYEDGLLHVQYTDGDTEDLTSSEIQGLLDHPPQPAPPDDDPPLLAKRKRAGSASMIPTRTQPRRKERLAPLPTAFKSAFFGRNPKLSCRGRRVCRISTTPTIYEIDDFLTEAELRHLDAIVTQQDAQGDKGFLRSFTDSEFDAGQASEGGVTIVSEQRTSKFFHLQKFGDAKV